MIGSNMPDKKPFFSVVIPALNEERYLPKLLKNLQVQLDRDFEVIVVDGSSEDKTVERAKKIQGIKVIISEKRNVSYQRNLGAKAAKGKWLVFLDADVQIPSNFLSQIHHFILEEKGCRFLTTWTKADSEDKSDRAIAMLINMLIETVKLIEKEFVGGYNMIIERTAFRAVGGFDERLRVSEDFDLTQKLVKSGRELHVLKSPKVTMSFRRFRREGTLAMLRKYSKSTMKILFEGPITQEMFDYPMGGKV